MQFQGLDEPKLLILMIAGGVFALSGLALMFRQTPQGDAAQIELFGIKFRSSSAGLLVFIVGALFVATPVFVPEKPPVVGIRTLTLPSGESESPPLYKSPISDDQGLQNHAVVLPAFANASEREPNDTVQAANELTIGVTYRGRGSREKPDWFVVSTRVNLSPANVHGSIEVGVRLVDGVGCSFHLFDGKERPIGSRYIHDGVYRKTLEIDDNDRFFFRINCGGSTTTNYEVFVSEGT